ncbi:MAG: hypothetical protein LBB23_01785 [Rickettsiales bacterium]|nr:hypothetical protein [Rickettsiales bacterium]
MAAIIISAPAFGAPKAVCRIPDLTNCIDSACAKDLSTDPGSRCTLCGSERASNIAKSKKDTYIGAGFAPTFQSLSIGAGNPKLLISDREMKNAPDAPDERYAWSIGMCIGKVPNCTNDDARDEYDKLIKESCRAFMTAEEYDAATSKVAAEKSKDECKTLIGSCMTNEARCGAGWVNCKANMPDSAFDQFYSSCLLDSGCADKGGAILAELKTMAKSVDDIIDKRLADAKQNAADARKARWETWAQSCSNSHEARSKCVENYCWMFDEALGVNGTTSAKTMGTTSCKFQASRAMAETLCGYVDDEVCKIQRAANFKF